MARIKVLNLYENGLDGPVFCIQCKEQYCLHCPEDAITQGSFGELIVSPTLCTLCGVCEKACPIGAIEIFNDIVYVCDLCGGRPKCVEACTEGAITYESDKGKNPSLEAFKKGAARMNPSQKRKSYLEKMGSSIRESWRR
jgi:Fe-S-cluster-containing hydrogenase component 2